MKYLKELIIFMIITAIVFLFKFVGFFTKANGFDNIFLMIGMILVLSIVVIITERQIEKNYKSDILNYDNLDFIKYVFSIIVIIVHLQPFLGTLPRVHIAFNNIVGRITVPLFFLISGYFVGKKNSKDSSYLKKYVKATIPLYLVWNIIYIPVLVSTIIEYWPLINNYINSINISLQLLIPVVIAFFPLIVVIALLYNGFYYHLWYFPALIISLIITGKWVKKFNIKTLLIISFILLLFGATETYYGFFPDSIQHFMSYYYDVFYTTRNFLFFGLFYVALGYFLGTKKEVYKKYSFIKVVVFIFVLIAEGLILQKTKRINSNILLACVPVTYYLFISMIYINNIFSKKFKYSFRELSKYYYFVHPFIIYIFHFFGFKNLNTYQLFIYIFLIILCTHFVSNILIKLKTKYPKLII